MIDFQFQGPATRIYKVQREPSAKRFDGILDLKASIIQIVTRMGHKKTAILAHFLKNQQIPPDQKGLRIARWVDTDVTESVSISQ